MHMRHCETTLIVSYGKMCYMFRTQENTMILSITEAAKRFKISRSKLYRMSDSGKISFSKKLDGSLGVDISELTRVFGDTDRQCVLFDSKP
ncbi:MAG: DNA-binding protein, partial [Sphingobacteriaceae bacterium]